MMNVFFKALDENTFIDKEFIKGYSPDEIAQIERLYNIDVKDDFKCFLEKIGHCDGGCMGDDSLIIYRKSWSVRSQLLFQINFFNDLQEIGAWDFLNKPFVFSVENESKYYFIQTSFNDEVYCYDENLEQVIDTGMRFCEYLINLMKKNEPGGFNISQGELIRI